MKIENLKKKGIIGGFIVNFIATIAITVILLVFILGAGIIKKVSNADGDFVIFDETKVGMANVFNYIDNYFKLVDIRFLMENGFDFDAALMEVNNDK
jgi:hypothetical protein